MTKIICLLFILFSFYSFDQEKKCFNNNRKQSSQTADSKENIKWESLESPVFSDPDDDFAKDPSIFYADGKYYMYYTGTAPGFQGSGSSWQIEYATSSDGLKWQKEGIVFKGDSSTWEDGRVQAPNRPVWYKGQYYMFYTGGPRKPKNLIYTGCATSTDLVNWTKSNEIILQNTDRANDIFIYKEGRMYYMFYTTYTKGEPIFVRQSKDLLNWSEPEPTGAGGEGTIVWKENGKYYLLGCHGYSGNGEAYRLYVSKSFKDFKDLGILDMKIPSFASSAFGHGDVIKTGNQIWFYFQGTNDGGDTFKIGLAKHTLD